MFSTQREATPVPGRGLISRSSGRGALAADQVIPNLKIVYVMFSSFMSERIRSRAGYKAMKQAHSSAEPDNTCDADIDRGDREATATPCCVYPYSFRSLLSDCLREGRKAE